MNTKLYLKIATLVVTIPVALSGCSKQNDPVDNLEINKNAFDVKVLSNGRLAFANNESFNATLTKIAAMSDSERNKWETQLGFHSLRTVNPDSQPIAAEMRQKFGMPSEYATLISIAGEYQIGNRISWFHDGFRYIAHSEEELVAIKNNTSLASEKFSAGTQKANVKTDNSTNRVVRDWSNTYGDGKYNNQPFYLNGDINSIRKINFESFMFVENATDRVNHKDGYNVYYTGLYLNEYYEYLNQTQQRWYRYDDYPRVTTYSLSGDYSIQGSNFYTQQYVISQGNVTYSGKGQAISGSISKSISAYSHSGGDYQTPIATAYLYSYHSEGDSGFSWIYNIQGYYGSIVQINNTGSAGGHSEGGYNGEVLW